MEEVYQYLEMKKLTMTGIERSLIDEMIQLSVRLQEEMKRESCIQEEQIKYPGR